LPAGRFVGMQGDDGLSSGEEGGERGSKVLSPLPTSGESGGEVVGAAGGDSGGGGRDRLFVGCVTMLRVRNAAKEKPKSLYSVRLLP